jgi:hypothetical protein
MAESPSVEEIGIVRDKFISAYVRRNPFAEPGPGTSLFAVLESASLILALLVKNVPGAQDVLETLFEKDEEELLLPDPNPEAYKPLITKDELIGEQVIPTGTDPNGKCDI